MKRLTTLYLILAVSVFQQFYGCRGCSQSGIRNSAEHRVERRTPAKFSSAEQDKVNTETKDTSIPAVSLNQLYNRYRSAVFMVLTSNDRQNYQGTGFFVTSDGIAVSNYHVFEGTEKGREIIKTTDGLEFKVDRVLAQSVDEDYIVFRVKLQGRVRYTPIPVARAVPEIGEDVFAIGNPLGFEQTLSRGIVSGYRANRSLIQTTAEITHGSSGGPLMNMKGEVVGITTAGVGEANLNFAVNIELLSLPKYAFDE